MRKRLLLLGIVVAVALLGVAAWVVSRTEPTSTSVAQVDRGDSKAVADAFLKLYARHDPAACELATPTLRQQLDQDGRCGGEPSGETPEVSSFFAKDCTNQAGFHAEVRPAGQLERPFANVDMQRVGDGWQVDSYLSVDDRGLLPPYDCAPTPTNVGG
ncbi:hypothetical protein GCM10012275_16420 [Longimycelium tulufanense]|uniref:Uncharacterized protein n=1 Tax=Longimycelium tulufanense TaxID=907463 RepID=A0A8J3CBV6_9PSEU|nr:hypothetical protein [Longimycelium tulufanense]GGM46137.1 hypothetical protein GCM10012275_16420 [Longimycelium tulufanense]